MPIGLSNIGWRMYIGESAFGAVSQMSMSKADYLVNASWNVVTFFLIVRNTVPGAFGLS